MTTTNDDVVNFQARVKQIRRDLLVITTNTFFRFLKIPRLSQAERKMAEKIP